MGGKRDAPVCLGVIAGPHGVRGQVVVKPFTEQADDVAAYGPVSIEGEDGEAVLTVTGRKKAGLIVCLPGIRSRAQAEALKGRKFHVPRERLGTTEAESWYRADLTGLDVVNRDGVKLGRIAAVQNYGAGDLLEVAPAAGGATVLLPFTRALVPEVDVEGGKVIAEPLQGMFEDE
jgi:16S rRNA processing protein RimM